MVFIAFLCYSGHFPYRSVPKLPFLLDAFTLVAESGTKVIIEFETPTKAIQCKFNNETKKCKTM